ncbi:sensor histidine kinase [Humibacillus xanthopallidus]|uniref:sensor histidine kinase n=1 Tax=Humibacillus xanthopallidus TaxID=412689 RepID=UPI00384F87C2
MNRLDVRLILSHLLVAVLGAIATYVIVRQLAPAIFDESMRMSGTGGMGGPGQGGVGSLREQFADAVDGALLVGALVGALAAALFGTFAAYRLIRPLATVRAATREMAQGRYAVPVPIPRETELADLATDVNTLGRALAETEERRVRLLGEVAHEMRTPLTVIDGYVEAMIDGVLPATPTELGRVSDEVRRLRRLSDDLSALSRAQEGRLHLVLRDVDLRSLAHTAAERLRPQAEDAGLTLVVDPATDPILVAADPDRISQVVTNLLGNAIRATPPGGELRVTCRRDDGAGLVEVADSGEGLDAADLERVFERFYRVPGRRSSEGDTGSGIGLTVARGIMRAHGGDLVAQSPGRGRGATFTARLPLGSHPSSRTV